VSHRGKNLVARDVLFGNDGLTSATVSVIGGFLVGHAGGGRTGATSLKDSEEVSGWKLTSFGLHMIFTWSSLDLHLVFT
jgi:hypothetical protein